MSRSKITLLSWLFPLFAEYKDTPKTLHFLPLLPGRNPSQPPAEITKTSHRTSRCLLTGKLNQITISKNVYFLVDILNSFHNIELEVKSGL